MLSSLLQSIFNQISALVPAPFNEVVNQMYGAIVGILAGLGL